MTALDKAAAAPSAKIETSDRVRGERRLGFYLTLPSYIVMLLVTAYPLGYALVLSLYNYRLTDPAGRSFVGLNNYWVIVTDPVWWNDFLTTLMITVVTVAVELVLGFMFAFVMLRIVRGRGPLRTAILIPYGIVTVVSAVIWRYAFAIDSGFVNTWLGMSDFNWFGDRWSAIFVICLSEIWKTTPFISLLLLAGLVQVPEDMQEAAKVDGATAWQRLWKVTLPNMKAAIMVALLFRTLDAFRIFDNIYVLTGGTNNTGSVSILGYDNLFKAFNIGLGSAISVLIFATVAIIAFIYIKIFGAAAPGAEAEVR